MGGADAGTDNERTANELYWGSDVSVNQIAEELDLSKGVLYGLIRPQPAGLSCPACGEEVVYPNRTAKERGMVSCPACGWEGEEDEAADVGGDGAVTLPLGDDDVGPPPAARLGDPGRRMVLGGALLGAAAGLALVLWARRR
ncbi:MAG TPA: hypothetical protein VK849_00055 [Longimicrobiales bacterium]|nr:hypothetical protein [Longimicrobiales bacterium]